ncbi:protein-L-isoaspartate(D-aspartate) O-methyltransferase [Planococcus lenghuensis]|uniref:Protein-L-isoaspartate O-methyltransferase n=1 Tax=Planococcus lenghuensis TaxID=2213202 RepID=A0A1Q2KUN4_9BACL|nr:protein-L-isoaspartate(D-aspartate) O-methyltransferase [Planococcus lenghuensis]AQQ51899.1 protein-L-isoaspartate O-methyltransferase [Planococcus lenghuensis]
MTNRNEEIAAYFRNMDRSFFMDTDKELARFDEAIPIGHGQTISQPSLVLKMTQLLDIKPDAKVLEIGTGSGFQTALLAAFSKQVYTVERVEPLYERVQERLRAAGYDNIRFRLGDGTDGWEDHAPYDRIMVTAAASIVPPALIHQLDAGGKMLIPVGSRFMQELQLIEKDRQGNVQTTVYDLVRFVPLRGQYE